MACGQFLTELSTLNKFTKKSKRFKHSLTTMFEQINIIMEYYNNILPCGLYARNFFSFSLYHENF